MSTLTDKVVSIDAEILKSMYPIKEIALASQSFEVKVSKIENRFSKYFEQQNCKPTIRKRAVELIIAKRGAINIEEILSQFGISERALERYFHSNIGLSPKFYSRIVRFASIFALVNKSKIDWREIAYHAGFFDQSHFIRNFKEFAGEVPCGYGFSENNLANFFLR